MGNERKAVSLKSKVTFADLISFFVEKLEIIKLVGIEIGNIVLIDSGTSDLNVPFVVHFEVIADILIRIFGFVDVFQFDNTDILTLIIEVVFGINVRLCRIRDCIVKLIVFFFFDLV